MPTQCGGKRKDTEEALLSLKGSLAQLAKAASIVDGNTGQEYQRKKLRKTLEDTTDWIFELFTEVKSNGRTHSLHFACPGKTMRFLSHRCPNWAQVGAFLLNRPTLECVVFEDEITGGNVVAPDPHRKVSVVYLGFWVLGEHLCDAKFWLPVCCCRHQLLVDHEGGGSGLMTMILGRLFLEPQILYHKDQSWKCKLVLRNFLADAPALRSAFSTKGANGMRPCALCSAVIGKRWDVDGCCSFDETNMDRWCRCTDSELRAMAAELRSAAQHESLAVLRKMEKHADSHTMSTPFSTRRIYVASSTSRVLGRTIPCTLVIRMALAVWKCFSFTSTCKRSTAVHLRSGETHWNNGRGTVKPNAKSRINCALDAKRLGRRRTKAPHQN